MIVGRNGQKSNRHTDFSRQNWFSPIRVVNRELIPPYRVVFLRWSKTIIQIARSSALVQITILDAVI